LVMPSLRAGCTLRAVPCKPASSINFAQFPMHESDFFFFSLQRMSLFQFARDCEQAASPSRLARNQSPRQRCEFLGAFLSKPPGELSGYVTAFEPLRWDDRRIAFSACIFYPPTRRSSPHRFRRRPPLPCLFPCHVFREIPIEKQSKTTGFLEFGSGFGRTILDTFQFLSPRQFFSCATLNPVSHLYPSSPPDAASHSVRTPFCDSPSRTLLPPASAPLLSKEIIFWSLSSLFMP